YLDEYNEEQGRMNTVRGRISRRLISRCDSRSSCGFVSRVCLAGGNRFKKDSSTMTSLPIPEIEEPCFLSPAHSEMIGCRRVSLISSLVSSRRPHLKTTQTALRSIDR
ncbi:hypothetical protein PMAYCL1PPCAC_26868, partial [Pristionchus mayeri]